MMIVDRIFYVLIVGLVVLIGVLLFHQMQVRGACLQRGYPNVMYGNGQWYCTGSDRAVPLAEAPDLRRGR